VNHAHRAVWWLALWAALLLVLGSAGCSVDDCPKESHCNGDVLERCESGSYGSYANDRWCGPGLCKGSDGDVFCALDEQPDERCRGSSSYVCDQAVLVRCYKGYATATYDCAVGESPQGPRVLTPGTSGACIVVAGSAECVAEAEPDPNCSTGPSYGSRCSGNARIDCIGDYVTQRTPCAPALCRQGQRAAVCALPEDPDVDCKADELASSFCVRNSVIQCSGAFRVSEKQCSADERCGFYPSVGSTCLTFR